MVVVTDLIIVRLSINSEKAVLLGQIQHTQYMDMTTKKAGAIFTLPLFINE
jgi:hypothetical protein